MGKYGFVYRFSKAGIWFVFLSFWMLGGCKKDPPAPTNPVIINNSPPILIHPPLAEAFGLAVPHFTHAREVDILARKDAGVSWVRRDISWKQVEPNVGTFDFTSADAVVDAELAAGIQVLAILNYGHPEYTANSGGNSHYPPDDLNDFGTYVRETVTHFSDRIDVWEIWNEPNFSTFWLPSPDPVAYGNLVKIAINEIQQADPNAQIMLGGMLGNLDPFSYGGKAWGFLEEVLAAHPGLLDDIDILSIHPYTWLQYVEPEVASNIVSSYQIGFIEMIEDCRNIATQAGHPDMPIWATEMGWHTAIQAQVTLGVTESLQADLWVRSCVLSIANGVEKVFPYTYSDGSGDLTDKESHFGMVEYLANAGGSTLPHNPKPAYYAYQTMTTLLAQCGFDKDLRDEMGLLPTTYAYRFNVTGSDKKIIVAWSIASLPGILSLDAAPQKIISIEGVELPVISSLITPKTPTLTPVN